MNYIERFKKDNNLKDNERFFIKNSNGDTYQVYFEGNLLKRRKISYEQNYLLLKLLLGEYKIIKEHVLTRLEYEMINYLKENGFISYKKIKGRQYVKREDGRNWYLLSANSIFKDLFKFSDEFNIDEVLEFYSIKD